MYNCQVSIFHYTLNEFHLSVTAMFERHYYPPVSTRKARSYELTSNAQIIEI